MVLHQLLLHVVTSHRATYETGAEMVFKLEDSALKLQAMTIK